MARYLFQLTSVTPAGSYVRLDSASGSTSPTAVSPVDSAYVFPGAILHSDASTGALPRVAAGVATLYQKTLDATGNVTATATLSGTLVEGAGPGSLPPLTFPQPVNPGDLGTYVRRDSAQVIDLNTKYGVHPGDDITTALQSAINTLASSGKSGEIRITEVGVYNLNGAQQAGTYTGAETYNYSGQVLIPARPFDGVTAPVITISGGVDPSMGWPFTGDAAGVTIKSNLTSGHIIDTMPYGDKWGFSWTGIMPVIRDLIFRVPDDPTAGGINVGHALRCRIERVVVATNSSWVIPTSGNISTAVGITLPKTYQNADQTIRDVDVRGFPTAFRISEHGVFDNVQIVGGKVAFISNNGGHHNWFGYVDVEEVDTIFYLETNAGAGGVSVYGFLDYEGNSTWPYQQLYVRQSTTAPNLYGCLNLHVGVSGSMGLTEPGSTSIDIKNVNFQQNSGWTAVHPKDTFIRNSQRGLPSTAGAPGFSWPTYHPWRVQSGVFSITSGSSPVMNMPSGFSARGLLPVLNGASGGKQRSVEAVFTKGGATHSFNIQAQRKNDVNQCIYVSLKNSTLYLGVGAFASGSGKVSASVSPGTTTKLRLDLYYQGKQPKVVEAWMDDVKVLTYTLTASDQALVVPGNFLPYLEDGTGFSDNDNTSTISSIEVRDLAGSPAGLRTGTATLVAGTVTVTDTNITASSIIRLHRQAAGGTTGDLSVSLSAGASFTINSSSGTDTSTVYYEVVSY